MNMPQDLHRHLLKTEVYARARDRAEKKIDRGDFNFNEFTEGCLRYWHLLKIAIANRDDDEVHTLIEKGLLGELTEKELDDA